MREILFYSWPTPALKGRTKKTKAGPTPNPPPPISHFTTWKEPLCYTCPPCEGRTFSTAGQHQLRKGGPCLQLINTSLKGEILTSSKRDLVYSWSTPALKVREILFYSWSTPALKGRTKKTKACATPPPPPILPPGKNPYAIPATTALQGRTYSTAGQHQLKGTSLSASG